MAIRPGKFSKKVVQAAQYKLGQFYRAHPLIRSYPCALRFFLLRDGPNFSCRFRFDDLRFRARKQDWSGVREVLLDGEYDFVEPLLADKNRPVVLDLGANIGCFALRVLAFRPDAKILSVEAARDTYEVLSENRELYGSRDWLIHHAGVWKSDGTIVLDRRGPSTSHRVADSDKGERIPAVSMFTLVRNYDLPRIDVLKMDIEGAEAEVVPNMGDVIRLTDVAVIELHNDRIDSRAVFDVLTTEFRCCWQVNKRHVLKPLLVFARKHIDLPGVNPVG